MKLFNMILNVSLLFFFFSFVCVEAQIPAFYWADCGVPGYRNIHYQSVTVSPYPVEADTTTDTLSINVEATIVNPIYDGDTYVSIWQDGVSFLAVQVADLCDIISTQNGLSCPIPVGKISFTYTFTGLPELPQGEYIVKISSSLPSSGEFGCLELGGEIEGAVSASSCWYNSYANTELAANFEFSQLQVLQRTAGSTFMIASNVTTYTSSPDLLTSTTIGQYSFQGVGLVTSHIQTNDSKVYELYNGTVSLVYSNTVIYTGYFNGSGVWDVSDPSTTSGGILTGTIVLDPPYQYIPAIYSYPLALGNLNPFTMKMDGGRVLTISGSREWCTCDIDACGVCGGDDSSCSLGSNGSKGMSAKEKAAIAIGVGGGILGLLLVAVLARSAKRARSAPLLNDQDLIDHPDKPDYGTMAIDEAIREGERV